MGGKPGQGTGGPEVGQKGGLATAEITRARRRRREQTAIEIVDRACRELQTIDGGIHSLVNFARRSNTTLAEFYRLWSKRIPSEVAGAGGGPIWIGFKRFGDVDASQEEGRPLLGETSQGSQAALAPE